MESSFTERRRMTRSGIYHCLYDTDGISTRQSLAQSLGLSLPTIYQNLAELVDLGLVRYSGEAQSTGGRRAAGMGSADGRQHAVYAAADHHFLCGAETVPGRHLHNFRFEVTLSANY